MLEQAKFAVLNRSDRVSASSEKRAGLASDLYGDRDGSVKPPILSSMS